MKKLKGISSQGMGLLEVIVCLGLLGGLAVCIVRTTGFLSKSRIKFDRDEDIKEIHLNAVIAARQLLLGVVDRDGGRTAGICSLVSLSNNVKSPVGFIKIDLANFYKKIVTNERLKEFLPEWIKVNDPFCVNSNETCLKLDTLAQVSEKIRRANPMVKFVIVPVSMDPMIAPLHSPLSSGKYDAKAIGFSVMTTIRFNSGKSKQNLEHRGFAWSVLAGTCDHKKGNKNYKLSFSGMDIVDWKDAANKKASIILNRPGFGVAGAAPPVDVTFRNIVAQEGSYNEKGSFIFADPAKNIVTSCREISWRCPNLSSSTREYSDLRVMGDVYYRTNNAVFSGSSMKIRMSYDIKKNGNSLGVASDKYFSLQGDDCSAKDAKGNVVKSCRKSASIEKVLGTTQSPISVAMWDRGSTIKSNNICRKICDKSSNYNTSGTTLQNKWVGYMKFEYVDFGKSDEFAVSDRVGCTSCYMKNCNQFGLGTFGPMENLPYQPLDAQIPECVVHEPTSVLYNTDPYASSPKEGTPWDKITGCVSARLDNTQDRLIFRVESCLNRLPVMCFSFGQYRLARDISSSGRSSLSEVVYRQAANRCFAMGRESIKGQSRLTSYLGQQNVSLPVRNGMYVFNNLASQGIFLAPQTSEDINYFRKWMVQMGVNSSNTWFWVALRKEGKNNLLPRLPLLPDNIDNEKYALFYGADRKLRYKEITNILPAKSSTDKAYPILVHNIKYKGVRLYGAGRSFSNAHYLCRKKTSPHMLFLSSARDGSITGGKSACAAQSGDFSPPLNTYEWVKAMLLLEPNDPLLPFPDPNKTSEIKKAWVAIEAKGSDAMGVDWKTYIP